MKKRGLVFLVMWATYAYAFPFPQALPVLNAFRTDNQLPALAWDPTLAQWVQDCPARPLHPTHMIFTAQDKDGVYLPKVIRNALASWANNETVNKVLLSVTTRRVGCAVQTCSSTHILLGCEMATAT